MNSSSRAKQKYNAKTYDRLQLMIPKGQKEVWKKQAESMGVSLNEFVQRAVKNYVEKREEN